MDALRSAMNDPGRPWYNRVADHAKVLAELGASFFAMDPTIAVAKAHSQSMPACLEPS
jgi:hypothetical protein